jgi:hypothetical protein
MGCLDCLISLVVMNLEARLCYTYNHLQMTKATQRLSVLFLLNERDNYSGISSFKLLLTGG